MATGSGASLVSYGLLVVTWGTFELDYSTVYMLAGGACMAIALCCMLAFPQFEAPDPQLKRMVLRRRYWLYYALQFMSGARRQIFVVFAAFMMVERFGFRGARGHGAVSSELRGQHGIRAADGPGGGRGWASGAR